MKLLKIIFVIGIIVAVIAMINTILSLRGSQTLVEFTSKVFGIDRYEEKKDTRPLEFVPEKIEPNLELNRQQNPQE